MTCLDKKGRAWAEINLDNVVFNFNEVKNKLGVKTMAVIKTDAYGIGAVPVARELIKEGVNYFAVAAPEEAVQLRNAGITTPILILGIVPECDIAEMSDLDITFTVVSVETAKMYIAKAKKPLKVHIKIDTGLSRLGFDAFSGIENISTEIEEVYKMPNLNVEGIFTHLSSPDVEEQDEYNRIQISLFTQTIETLHKKGVNIPIKHCLASAGILRYQNDKFDMVRPGLLLHGVPSEPWMQGLGNIELKPVMEIRTRITQIKTIEAGTKVGYGCTWEASQPCKLATISFGYSDGLYRANAGHFSPLLNGKRVKQVGRICMDMCMLDITDIDAKVGDIVTILGKDGNDEITFDELVDNVPTCHDDFFSAVGKRIPRIYYRNGIVIDRLEYIK